ncbi:hypothetical protein A0256_06195 [Mucilaginibacter sp. PAMC 26640]|nr:hypothetical protein A0256_06195 [Mucilaginibacter sp. PAMC 26640]
MAFAAFRKFKNQLFADITSVPEELKASYYPFMDGLRGVAILTVILAHVTRDQPWSGYLDGTIGVHIFFILSGFLITTLLIKEKLKYGTVSLKKFYARRALRIFPVAYLYILVLIILNYAFKLQIVPLSFIGAALYLKNFPVPLDWYTGHFWTLSIEEQFYLFAPIILITSLNRYLKVIVFLCIAVPLLNYLAFNNISVFYTNRVLHVVIYIILAILDRGALYILSGSLLAVLLFKNVLNLQKLSNSYYLSSILFCLALVIHYPFTGNLFVIPYFSAIASTVLITAVIGLNLVADNLLTKLLSNPILVKTGILSYSIYIWQQIFTLHQPWAGYFKYADSLWLNLPAMLLVSYLSYTFYENRFLRLKKHFSRS